MAEMRMLYGVIIREAMATGDKELMQAVSKVSTFMLSRAAGRDEALNDWQNADGELKKALS
ncbi:hypothetical protein [Hoeflea ulvae]|uniref:Uncharacterized protein n=1 Tax=Hoeflea ulvae TaxID=2983764 RepID=A0ABT3YDN0_9HYPH|nr:hypothetical protein [Hoeflea ulvae]MCY0093927.1 hypothetical protein [Hoeflea ulvae]